ncbi:hypothetical protein GCM10020254_22790 [Streptomyces goshikiensis]
MHETARARIPAQKVLRHSVRGQVLDALRAALVDGDLVPGEIYSGPALGERFGVSATPVREAMQQLALEGAVECLPNRGFRVLTRTPGGDGGAGGGTGAAGGAGDAEAGADGSFGGVGRAAAGGRRDGGGGRGG